jgi:DNA-binding response OmpR family regulator
MPAKSSAQGAAHKYDDLLRQVADSEPFRTAPTMRALLFYLWEHQREPISEYAIATEALGRSPDFDPKLDSTVRVQVARLRAKLKDFYQAGDGTFPLRLSVPLGRQ